MMFLQFLTPSYHVGVVQVPEIYLGASDSQQVSAPWRVLNERIPSTLSLKASQCPDSVVPPVSSWPPSQPRSSQPGVRELQIA